MSDALLTRIAEGIEKLHTLLGSKTAAPAAGKPAAAPAGKPAAPAGKPAAPAGKPATAPAAKPAAAGAKPGAAAAVIKGPGKYDSAGVLAAIQKVALSPPPLGKPAAMEVLDTDGGGATSLKGLDPSFYDAVVDACNALLAGDSAPPAEEDNDLGI